MEGIGTGEGDLEALLRDVDVVVWEADARSLAFRYLSGAAERVLGRPASSWLADPGLSPLTCIRRIGPAYSPGCSPPATAHGWRPSIGSRAPRATGGCERRRGSSSPGRSRCCAARSPT
jgi:hypothetical protein